MTEIRLKSDIDVTLIDHMGSDLSVAGAAWVCTDHMQAGAKNNADKDAVPGLVNYLMKHRHGTPFEHNAMTFSVSAPIFVWREWHRHRIGFSYNEQSARYSKLEPVFFMPWEERPMFKVDDWKPGRPKFLDIQAEGVRRDGVIDLIDKFETTGEREARRDFEQLCFNLKTSYQQSYDTYEENLALGIDPGLARDCLPVGIYSTCWVTCNARSLMAFLSLRTHEPAAQFVSYPLAEIEDAARKLEAVFARLFPLTHAAFVKNGRVAP